MKDLRDDQVAGHLRRRASKGVLEPDRRERIVRAVAEGTAAAAPHRLSARRRPTWAAAAALVAIAVVVGALAIPWRQPDPPATSATLAPTGESSTSALSSEPDLPSQSTAQGAALSAEELLALARDPAHLGQVVIADTAIEPLPEDLSVAGCIVCPIGTIGGRTVVDAVSPVFPAPSARVGRLALQIIDDGFGLLGGVTESPNGGAAWPPADAEVRLQTGAPGELIVVDGWLVTGDAVFGNCGPQHPGSNAAVASASQVPVLPKYMDHTRGIPASVTRRQ